MSRLPEQYLQNMKELLKDDYDQYLDSFSKKRYYGLRVNTSRISVEDFLKIAPFHLEPISWTDDGFYYDEEERPSRHPYFYAGLYYLQEPSAMLPAEALPINEGDIVLDACAAPGGKSSKLANRLKGSGFLVSNDISVSRCQVLLKNLETMGIVNACVMAEDITKLDRFENFFDKILIDAPCSGEGMFRKEPSLIREWEEKGNTYYSDLQKKIIASAIRLLKDGGKMVYSTCTFSPQEDEEIIEYALNTCPDLKVLPIETAEGFEPGISDHTGNCVRLYPHKIRGEGHFVALLQKKEEPINKKKRTQDRSFSISEDISITLPEGNIVQRGEKLYYEPISTPDLKGLRVLRSGLFLGEEKHGRFEPSQSLSMALKEKEYKNTLNLCSDDPRVLKYLKCETLDVKDFNKEGTVLVCADSYPLGFGKIKNGILKNRYPANYRYK
ncbi:MAG: RsmB/NOP family class I SAM-dependent RNA methyltransferase [Erysipelotrichaceae bacterium]|nr:RsmB/NOP family class I SAM-dependent RNA methyltransferase [Erysipelotrichaceae bacterium]